MSIPALSCPICLEDIQPLATQDDLQLTKTSRATSRVFDLYGLDAPSIYLNKTPKYLEHLHVFHLASNGKAHVSHKECAPPWLNEQPNCPTCRAVVAPSKLNIDEIEVEVDEGEDEDDLVMSPYALESISISFPRGDVNPTTLKLALIALLFFAVYAGAIARNNPLDTL